MNVQTNTITYMHTQTNTIQTCATWAKNIRKVDMTRTRCPLKQWSNSKQVSKYRVVQKKLHKVECTIILQPFAIESCGFHQNAHERITVYQSMQNYLYQLVKYSLINSRNWIHAQTFKYSILDAVPPIHGESYHVATDKDPSMPPSWRQVPVYF